MRIAPLLIFGSILVLGGCNWNRSVLPTGQVIATINGDEITAAELRLEMNGLSQTGKRGAELEKLALQSLISRHLLADAAAGEKLDKRPVAAVLQKRAGQDVLVEMLMQQFRGASPPVSREESEQYVADHPALFDQRRIFIVDQVILQSNSAALIRKLENRSSLEEMEALATHSNVGATRTVGTIDALGVDADFAEKLTQLPPEAIFILPDGAVTRINKIRTAIIEPVTGAAAVKLAQEMIARKRGEQMAANKSNLILEAGKKAVKYNPRYQGTKIS